MSKTRVIDFKFLPVIAFITAFADAMHAVDALIDAPHPLC